MSPEEILNFFYDTVTYTHTAKGWRTAFAPERLRGIKLTKDLINAKTGKVAAEAGTKITPRLAKKLIEGGMKEQLVSDDELVGHYIATDIINERPARCCARPATS